MPTNEPKDRMPHEQCLLMLTSFVNGTLSRGQQRQIQEHLGHCEECFEELQLAQRISDGLNDSPAELEGLLSKSRMEANLLSTLDNAIVSPKTDKIKFLSEWRKNWHNTPVFSKSLVWSQAACLAVLATFIGISPSISENPLTAQTDSDQQFSEYRTLSDDEQIGVRTDQYLAYRIIFHAASTELDIRQLMNSVGAQIISGPSVSGVYTIAVVRETPQQDLILRSLRNSPWIKLAEPVISRVGQ